MTFRSLWLGALIALIAISAAPAQQSRQQSNRQLRSKSQAKQSRVRRTSCECESTVDVGNDLVAISGNGCAGDCAGDCGGGCVSCQACPGNCTCDSCAGGACCGCGMECGCRLGQKTQCIPYPRCFNFYSPCVTNRCCGGPCCTSLLGEMFCDFKDMLDKLKGCGRAGCPSKPFGFSDGGCCDGGGCGGCSGGGCFQDLLGGCTDCCEPDCGIVSTCGCGEPDCGIVATCGCGGGCSDDCGCGECCEPACGIATCGCGGGCGGLFGGGCGGLFGGGCGGLFGGGCGGGGCDLGDCCDCGCGGCGGCGGMFQGIAGKLFGCGGWGGCGGGCGGCGGGCYGGGDVFSGGCEGCNSYVGSAGPRDRSLKYYAVDDETGQSRTYLSSREMEKRRAESRIARERASTGEEAELAKPPSSAVPQAKRQARSQVRRTGHDQRSRRPTSQKRSSASSARRPAR